MGAPLEDVAELYRAGQSLREIAAQAGCTHMTVRKRLLAAGVEMRPIGAQAHRRARPVLLCEADIERRYVGGQSMARIAADLGVGETTIWTRLRRRGVPIRPPGGVPGRRHARAEARS